MLVFDYTVKQFIAGYSTIKSPRMFLLPMLLDWEDILYRLIMIQRRLQQ